MLLGSASTRKIAQGPLNTPMMLTTLLGTGSQKLLGTKMQGTVVDLVMEIPVNTFCALATFRVSRRKF